MHSVALECVAIVGFRIIFFLKFLFRPSGKVLIFVKTAIKVIVHMGVSLSGGIPKTPQNDHF